MHFKETLFAVREAEDTFSQKCHFCLLQTVVVLVCLTLMMPSGALSWVCQGTMMLPAPHLVTPLSKSLSCVQLRCIRPSPGKGEPRPLPLSEISQRSQCRICAVPGCCSALQGLLDEDRRAREESQALLKGSFAGRSSSQYYLLKKLIIVCSGASQRLRLRHGSSSSCAV